eukprot:gene4238-4657_t
MSADALTTTSRTFYERAKGKVAFSIVIASCGLVMLGFCASVGGQAQAARDSKGDSDANDSLAAGYGFAAFCFIVASLLFIGAAVYFSPLFFGTANEKKILRSPQEIEASFAPASAPLPSAAEHSRPASGAMV